MIEIEVLENKIYFRDGMRLAGPLDHEGFHESLVRIADELLVSSVGVLIVYLEHRKNEVANKILLEIDVHNSSGDFILQIYSD